MAGFSTEFDAKEYAHDYLHQKVYGAAPSSGDVFTDIDPSPGGTGPTDPGPPDDDPTQNQVEAYILARAKRTAWVIGNAWRNGNP